MPPTISTKANTIVKVVAPSPLISRIWFWKILVSIFLIFNFCHVRRLKILGVGGPCNFRQMLRPIQNPPTESLRKRVIERCQNFSQAYSNLNDITNETVWLIDLSETDIVIPIALFLVICKRIIGRILILMIR